MDRRGAFVGKPAPGPFQCLACKTYVTGTASGHCPRCGFVPPVAPAVPTDTPAPKSSASTLYVVGVALVLAGAVLLVAILR